jgi:glycosyltransferase involved in cell wall biosynthesis
MSSQRSSAPVISVLVATYGRPELLPRALRSVALQTLPEEQYEVIVIANGPHERVPGVLGAARSAYPRVQFRLLETATPGAAHARNLGLLAARGDYVTILDDDDWISPAYLEGLLAQISPRMIPLAGLAEVRPSEPEPSMDNYVARAVQPHRGRVVSPTKVHQGISVNVCKLLPTDLAREVLYDESLRSGEDFVFWTRIFARTQFRFAVVPGSDAVYFRWYGENSVSRQSPSFDFSVVQRQGFIQALDPIPTGPPEVEVVLEKMLSGQVGFAHHYLVAHPEDVVAAKVEYEKRTVRRVPWERFVARPS